MKDKIGLLITGYFALFLSSCMGNDDADYVLSKDAQVYHFHLESDSLKSMDKVKFTIDQLTGTIYNADSMAYGTDLKDKMICTYTTLAVIGVQVIQEGQIGKNDDNKDDTTTKSDTIWWNRMDSLDFSKPVWFINYAQDGGTTKKYKAWVNVHTVKPDSMDWVACGTMPSASLTDQTVVMSMDSTSYIMYAKEGDTYKLYSSPAVTDPVWSEAKALKGFPTNALIRQLFCFGQDYLVPAADGKLYRSSNMTDWQLVADAPEIVALMGRIQNYRVSSTVYKNLLAAVVRTEDGMFYATSYDLENWELGDELQEDFPVSGFGWTTYSLYREGLMVAGGRDKSGLVQNIVWGTYDGKYWAQLTDSRANYFTRQEGLVLANYDDRFYLIGGMDGSGKGLKQIYTSSDYGISWAAADSLKEFPEAFKARGFASSVINKDNYLYLFGGKQTNGSAPLDQVWRGRLNRLGFKD